MAYALRYERMGTGWAAAQNMPLQAEFWMFLSYTTWNLINQIIHLHLKAYFKKYTNMSLQIIELWFFQIIRNLFLQIPSVLKLT